MANKEHINEAVALLSRLIATPSISRDETDAADILEDYLRAKNLCPNRKGNNLWCLSKAWDDAKPVILLNAHIDTVKPVVGWQRDPFAPMQEGDMLYGLGSNDCGGGLMTLLQTFLILNSQDTAFNMIYLASCEEEVSGKNGIECVLPLLPAVDFAIVGDEGDNAIYHAMDDIKWLSEWQFPLKTELLGPVKNTVTIVNAGTQHNVIPDACAFTIDVRSNECYSNEDIFEYFRAHLSSELKARSFRLSSSRIDPSHPFVQICVENGLKPFGSPTLSDQALMRFPSLKLGPGESSRSHTADEFIRISEMEQAVDMYVKLLTRYSAKLNSNM